MEQVTTSGGTHFIFSEEDCEKKKLNALQSWAWWEFRKLELPEAGETCFATVRTHVFTGALPRKGGNDNGDQDGGLSIPGGPGTVCSRPALAPSQMLPIFAFLC